MARLPYLDVDDLDAADRDLLKRPINLFRVLANNPTALRQWSGFSEWIRWHGTVDPRLRELAIIEVGITAKSPYEFTHHVVIGKRFGVTDDDLADLGRFAAGEEVHQLAELDVAVLTAARELTLTGGIEDATWQRLIAELGRSVTVELIIVIGFYNMVVRVLAALAVDVEPPYDEQLPLFNT